MKNVREKGELLKFKYKKNTRADKKIQVSGNVEATFLDIPLHWNRPALNGQRSPLLVDRLIAGLGTGG